MHCGPWKETANGGVWRCETCNCPQGLGCWYAEAPLSRSRMIWRGFVQGLAFPLIWIKRNF